MYITLILDEVHGVFAMNIVHLYNSLAEGKLLEPTMEMDYGVKMITQLDR